ncbi:uncharacterized protein LOC133737572 [Rosa rugosa]|uniref:uncharacterized protein LOC133737572 n=1 Tax=Rosa rugosa TaxID=74645 RepID=UPI002B40A01D|nr:uncharacterized protein LOC133737572 [Rosa rugosa]
MYDAELNEKRYRNEKLIVIELANLKQRKILEDPCCWQCGWPTESVIHVLWECPKANKTWRKNFFEWNWLWRNRNLNRYGEKSLEPAEVAHLAAEWKNEFVKLGVPNHDLNVAAARHRVQWKPQSQGHIKLNFDEACDTKNGVCGLGVVFRDYQGVLKGALAVPQVGNLPPRSVEALALLHGLRFADHVGFSNIEVEGDALSIINALQDNSENLSSEGHVIDEVKFLFQSLSICSSHFVNRERNMVAHRLSKEALKVSQPILCLELGPSWLHQYVSIDFQCEV